jgi:hypothetical protein
VLGADGATFLYQGAENVSAGPVTQSAMDSVFLVLVLTL